jgi:hypothetical protein
MDFSKYSDVIALWSHDKARKHTGGIGIGKKLKKHNSIW